jgi:hypothetical protein
MSVPNPDNDQPMRDVLRRDAARVLNPDFDPTLHYATMRRVRAIVAISGGRSRRVPMFATAVAVLAMVALAAFWMLRSLPDGRVASELTAERKKHDAHPPVPPSYSVSQRETAPRASLFAYQVAANDSDAALFAALDRDAAALLPRSSRVFNTTFP